MADDSDNINDGRKLREDLDTARDLAKVLQNIISENVSNKKVGDAFAKSIYDQLRGELDLNEKLNILQKTQNDYVREQARLGWGVNNTLLNNITAAKNILKEQITAKEQQKENADAAERTAEMQERIKSELYDGLGLMGEWLKAGTSLEMASRALNSTIETISASFESTIGNVVSLNRELGISRENAAAITAQSTMAGLRIDGWRFSTDDLNAASREYITILGTANGLSGGITRNIADLIKLTGDAEGAVELSTIFEHASHDSELLTANIKQLAEREGVASARVFKDMVHSSNLLVGASEQQIKNFVKQNVELQKQGLSMETLESVSSNMLDIETSLRAQSKARALLGDRISETQFKSMDLVRQQALAYQSGAMNIDEFGKAISDTVVSQQEFNELGPAGQRIYSEAIGMTVKQLEEVYLRQAAIKGQLESSAISKGFANIAGFWESTPSWIKKATSALAGYLAQMVVLNTVQKGSILGGAGRTLKSLNPFSKKGAGAASGLNGQSSPLPDPKKGVGGLTKSKDLTGGLSKSMGKINTTALIKGAAALVIAAGALWVLGKAVQEFENVGWEQMAKAGVSILGLTGIMIGLGAVMSSGVGGVAIIAGAAAMVVMAGGVFILGKALNTMLPVFKVFGDIFIQALGQVPEIIESISTGFNNMLDVITLKKVLAVTLLGAALFGLASGLTAFGVAGILAIPALLALTAIDIDSFGNMIEKAFDGVASIITSVADGFNNMLSQITLEKVLAVTLLGAALFGLAGGLTAFGVAGILAIPTLIALSAINLDSFGNMIEKTFKQIPKIIESVSTGINELLSQITLEKVLAVGLLGVSLFGLASGLTALSIASILAIPAIMALSTINLDSFGNMIEKSFEGVASIITSVADGFNNMLSQINLKKVLAISLMGTALFGLASGLTALSIAGMLAIPTLIALTAIDIDSFGNMIEKSFEGVASIITSVAGGFSNMFSQINLKKVATVTLMSAALFGLAGGLTALSIAGMLTIPTLMALSTINLDSFGNMIEKSFEGVDSIITSVADGFSNMLSQMSLEKVAAVTLMSGALFGLASGLTSLGIAGIIAMPAIGALMALATVAPALSKLSNSFGMDDEDESDDSKSEKIIQTENKELIAELRGLRKDIQTQPIVLNIDGKMVSKITKVQSRHGVNERSFK